MRSLPEASRSSFSAALSGEAVWPAAAAIFDPSSETSRLKEILGLSHPYDGQDGQSRKVSGDIPMLLTQAEAIIDHGKGNLRPILGRNR